MTQPRLSIRIDLASGSRIGPGKIALLEAIRKTGSIAAGAREIGMSYRRAWLLVEEINQAFQKPAVAAAIGGKKGGGATVTAVGDQIIDVYHAIEEQAQISASRALRPVEKLIRTKVKKSV